LQEIRKKSALPIYGAAAACLIYCLFFNLYKLSDFLILAAVCLAVYFVLSKVIPDRVTYVEVPKEPVSTGSPEIDALLQQGAETTALLRKLSASIRDSGVKKRSGEIADLTERIFNDLIEDPTDYKQVKRFSANFLPTTVKLLENYAAMEGQGISGVNIDATKSRISAVLDKTAEAYRRQLDALFANQALDIDTDIDVLNTLLKKEGLTGSDFGDKRTQNPS
jgi:5-bromo-4-chloroindolyl phosphate hydrolysis protein